MKVFHWFLGNQEFFLKLYTREARKKVTWGYTNRTQDGKYVPFLDYDGLQLDHIVSEVRELIKKYRMGDAFVFQSSERSYHVVFLDKVSLHEFMGLLEETSTDQKYRILPYKYGRKNWILRLGRKGESSIHFVGIIEGLWRSGKGRSTAHRKTIEKVFNIELPLYPDEDGYRRIIGARYPAL